MTNKTEKTTKPRPSPLTEAKKEAIKREMERQGLVLLWVPL